ncbi:MAG: efflux RND transporter permease subunit, partial [Polyangiales bacterium]
MIDRLIELAVRQRLLVVILSVVFLALGIMAARRVPIDAVPDVTDVQVQIITAAPALGPTDVERNVTFPVERAMAGLPDVLEIRSQSRAGISVVTVVFDDAVSIYLARQLIGERLAEARSAIPPEYGTPTLGPISSGLGEVFHFEVRGDGHELMELRAILDWQITPRLKLVPGVTEVNPFGGEAKTLEIELDPQKLAAAQVDVAQVLEALSKNDLAVGGAYLVLGRENVTIRGEGRIRTPEDLGAVVVEHRDGRTPLYLRDLGVVHFAPLVRYGAATRDARGEAVIGVVMMLRGANSGEVVEAVKEAVADIGKSLPKGVTIDVYYDRTELVHRTIHTVRTNLLEASALVVLVLLVTLASLRAGSVVAVVIPLALLGVFVGMWAWGIQGNLLSLGAIDFGLVVDGAIIIVENAQRHLGEKRTALGRKLTDEERRETVIAAAVEVRSATAFGEIIIALVYVPILALEGVEGRMFRPMAMAVLFALAAAFVLSLTLVPALASLVLSRDTSEKESFFIRALHRVYRPLLASSLRIPRLVTLGAIALFGVSLFISRDIGREFVPKLDEGTIVLPTVRLPSVSLEQAMEQARQIEAVLLKQFPEVTSVIGRTGRAE